MQGAVGGPGPAGPPGPPGPAGFLAGYFAQQNANLSTVGPNQGFVDVPGASVTATLPADGTLELDANGSVSGVQGNATPPTATHCGFRFVVDGMPYGDASWGDVIVGCGVSSQTPGWWCPWTMRRSLAAKMGAHTVKVQQTGWSGTTAGCSSASAEYSAARLRVLAR
jgi:hypothetical protein